MGRGFMDMRGASVLGCGNNWTGPSTTSPVLTRFPGQNNKGFAPAPTEGSLPRETEEIQLGKAIGCSLCDAKKKMIAEQRRAAGILEGRLQVVNGARRPYLGGQPEEGTLDCPACGLDGARISEQAAKRMGQMCAARPTSSDGMSCQRTSTGDIVCSNGIVYANDCPNSPSVNYPGVAVNVGKTATPPPAPGAAPAPSTVQTPVTVTSDGVVVPAPAPSDSGVSPILIGAGALAGVGLILLLLK